MQVATLDGGLKVTAADFVSISLGTIGIARALRAYERRPAFGRTLSETKVTGRGGWTRGRRAAEWLTAFGVANPR